MKKFLSWMVAGMAGSAMTLAGVHLFSDAEPGARFHEASYADSRLPAQHASFNGHTAAAPFDFSKAAERTMPSVVHIQSTRPATTISSPFGFQFGDPFREFFGDDFFGPRRGRTQVSTGSGVILTDDGYIVTNNHVVAEAQEVEVSLHDNRSFKAEVVGTDPSTDLAVLRIEADGLAPAMFGNSDELKVGEWVLAVGNPFNLNSTVTAGIVSAKGRDIEILRDKAAIEAFIQTDAAVNPGNSGGALVDSEGRLVGINTAIASPTGAYAGYSFSVPGNLVRKIADDIIKYGKVQRAYLGLRTSPVDGKTADKLGLNVTEGVLVDELAPGSPADQAGLKPGDVITAIEGHKVRNSADYRELVGRYSPGDKVRVTVDRYGAVRDMTITLENEAGTTEIQPRQAGEAIESLGAEFQTLSREESAQYGVDGGVRVSDVGRGKLRQSTGIKQGFVITKVNQKPVYSVEELSKELDGRSGGVMLEGFYPGYSGSYYYAFGL